MAEETADDEPNTIKLVKVVENNWDKYALINIIVSLFVT